MGLNIFRKIKREKNCFTHWLQILVNSTSLPPSWAAYFGNMAANLLPSCPFLQLLQFHFSINLYTLLHLLCLFPTSQLSTLTFIPNIPAWTITRENHTDQEEWSLFLCDRFAGSLEGKVQKTITKCCLATFEYMYICFINYWYITFFSWTH